MKKIKSKVVKAIMSTVASLLVIAIVVALVMPSFGFGPIYGFYEPQSNKKYESKLKDMGIFDDFDSEMPQTVVHKLVTDHFNSPLPEGKTAKKCIIIGYDGYRADALANIANSPESAVMHVKEQGGLYHTFAGGIEGGELQNTSTAPGWCSMLTGGWADYHGLDSNGKAKNSAETLLTTLAKQGHAGSFTVSWRQHTKLNYRPDIIQSIEEGLPIEYNHCIDDVATFYTVLNYVSKPAGVEKTAQEDPDVIFLTLEFTDHAGHTYGFGNSSEYEKASIEADTFGYEIVKAIEQRSTYAEEDWLIIVTTDHGGTKHNHGGQTQMERNTWLATNKKIDITDEYLNYAMH